MKKHWVVLYDGDCGFCNYWVKFILKRDANKKFRFAPLQGKYGQDFLQKNNLFDLDSIVVIDDIGAYKIKSNAVIEILYQTGGFLKLAILGKIVPKFIADKLYDLVARNRKALMGESCFLPSVEEKLRFIS